MVMKKRFRIRLLREPKGNNFKKLSNHGIGKRIVGSELFVLDEGNSNFAFFTVPFAVIDTAIEIKEGKPLSLNPDLNLDVKMQFRIPSSFCKIVD